MFDGSLNGGHNASAVQSLSVPSQGTQSRPRWYDFLIESSEEERRIINFGLSSAITDYLLHHRAVYLEGLGIVFSKEVSRNRIEESDRSFKLSSDKLLLPEFEKCSELVSYQREQFKNIVDTKELSKAVSERIAFFVKWRDRKLERYLHGFLNLIRHEVVTFGYSLRLSQFCRFFGLHNRQGNNTNDWFSGADVFINSDFESIVSTDFKGEFVRPIYGSAWEPFEAWAGKPISIFTINPREELSSLGLRSIADKISSKDELIQTAMYRLNNGDGSHLVFATNGMRQAGIQASGVGCEFTLNVIPRKFSELSLEDLQRYGCQPISLAWLLMNESTERCPEIGNGVTSGRTLWHMEADGFRSILLTKSNLFPREQVSTEGRFRFANITLLFADEAQAVAEVGSQTTLMLLGERQNDQINREVRTSIFGKSGRLLKNSLHVPSID